jgi:hypothetical protein
MKQQQFSMPNAQELDSLINFCKVMATAPFYQKLGPGGVMAIYMTAKEYNLPFMACLNGGLHTFDGKVTFSAIMIDALILNAGHKTDVLHLDDQCCKIRFIRGDRKNDPNYKPFEFEYTLQQAAKAGYLNKANWKTSPKDMLYSRCITGGGRKHIPEVFVGVLVSGELVGDNSDSNITPLLPLIENTHLIPLQTESEEPKQLEFVKNEGYEDFVKKYLDKEGSLIPKYIDTICEKSKKNEIQIWNFAMKYEKEFSEKFEKWKETL